MRAGACLAHDTEVPALQTGTRSPSAHRPRGRTGLVTRYHREARAALLVCRRGERELGDAPLRKAIVLEEQAAASRKTRERAGAFARLRCEG